MAEVVNCHDRNHMKKNELISTGLYKGVQFSSAIDVGLSKNSTREEFISTDSDLNKNVTEVLSFSTLHKARCNCKLSTPILDISNVQRPTTFQSTYYYQAKERVSEDILQSKGKLSLHRNFSLVEVYNRLVLG